MNAKVEAESATLDTVKLTVSMLLIAVGIGAFYYYEEYSTLLRVIGLLAVAGVSVAIVLQTAIGRRIWTFAVDARTEVRKVVWPTRQETVQTTLIVMVMVLLVSIFLWLVDMFLMWVVRTLTGYGG